MPAHKPNTHTYTPPSHVCNDHCSLALPLSPSLTSSLLITFVPMTRGQ